MAISSLNTGISIFSNAQQRVQDSALKIAKSAAGGATADLLEPLIDLKVAEQQASAAAKIIEVEGKQIGTLLDIFS